MLGSARPRDLALVLTAWCLAALLPAQRPERKPDAKAPPQKVFKASSKGGLDYTWSVPKGYAKKGKKHSLTVICHGTGLDHRWGHANNPVGVFRTDDVVVSVDGTSPGANGTRLFLGKPADAKAFHEFLGEMRDVFAVDRVFLYGHSQGGFFVCYYAGEYPEDVDGVVAHASGAWNWSKTGKPVRRVAFAFMHGTGDPVVPYRQSVGTRDHYAKLGFPMLLLRRMPGYNHWPNATRANEALAWCEGMTTQVPEVAIAAAELAAETKKPDQYRYSMPAAYGAAQAILNRIDSGKPNKFEGKVSDKVKKRAAKLQSAIDKAATKAVKAMKKKLPNKKAFKLTAKATWIQDLIAMGEDFAGVESVENYLETLKYRKAQKAHNKAAGKILEAFYGEDRAAAYRAAIQGLPKAFLYDGYPANFAEKLEATKDAARQFKLKKKEVAAFEVVEHWRGKAK